MIKDVLKKGDKIKCHDEKEGYMTDFFYEKDGQKGLWLEITKGIRKKHESNKD